MRPILNALRFLLLTGSLLTLPIGFSAYGETLNPDCGLLVTTQRMPINAYLKDTLNSLESMRGENGFLVDTIWVRSAKTIEVLNPDTSPTNIAVDLLIQAELGQIDKVERVLETLANVEFHKPTGLFFSRYTTNPRSRVTDLAVSSIDNMHLALALFTIQESFRDTRSGALAKQLFERMNFSVYYDPRSGLIGGNLRHSQGAWIKEEYNFSYFGSEARILYSAGWALGLFRDYSDQPDFLKKSLAALDVEIHRSHEGDLLKLWDGSAFQLLFPMMFIGEENYSSRMKEIFIATGNFMIADGRRRGLPFPAAHSAGRASISENDQEPAYKDKAGNHALISSRNSDQFNPSMKHLWDTTFTPYALFMAASLNPNKFAGILGEAQKAAWKDNRLYVDGMGWMDGIHVSGPHKGQVVSAQLSLNQGMIALSLLRMRANDKMNLSSRALFENPEIRKRLQEFYRAFDDRLN